MIAVGHAGNAPIGRLLPRFDGREQAGWGALTQPREDLGQQLVIINLGGFRGRHDVLDHVQRAVSVSVVGPRPALHVRVDRAPDVISERVLRLEVFGPWVAPSLPGDSLQNHIQGLLIQVLIPIGRQSKVDQSPLGKRCQLCPFFGCKRLEEVLATGMD